MSGLHTRSPPAPPRDLVVRLKPHFQRSLKVCACRALLRAAPSCWLSPLIPAPDLHVTPRVPQHKLQPVVASPWSRCQGTRAKLIPEEGGGGPTAQDLVQASSGGRETGPLAQRRSTDAVGSRGRPLQGASLGSVGWPVASGGPSWRCS